MDTQPPQQGESESDSSLLLGATSNTSLIGTQPERRHQLVHSDAANVASKDMTQNAHLKIVRKTGRGKNQKRHAVGCEYIHNEVNGCQSTV